MIYLKLCFQWVTWVCSKRVSKCLECKSSKPFFKSNYWYTLRWWIFADIAGFWKIVLCNICLNFPSKKITRKLGRNYLISKGVFGAHSSNYNEVFFSKIASFSRQKQPPECSIKKVFYKLHKIHWKTPVPESLF